MGEDEVVKGNWGN